MSLRGLLSGRFSETMVVHLAIAPLERLKILRQLETICGAQSTVAGLLSLWDGVWLDLLRACCGLFLSSRGLRLAIRKPHASTIFRIITYRIYNAKIG